MNANRLGGALAALVLALGLGSNQGFAQKYGGTLNAMIGTSTITMILHETIGQTVMTLSPVYNNLTIFDQLKAIDDPDNIRPELAERWAWSDEYATLTFTLRKGVAFHDGKPLTSNDVKHTFDIVRGVSTQRLKLNPRKSWFSNIKEITTNGDHEVAFRLKRPQPSLLTMLSTNISPVMPAHRTVAEWRQKAIGTGPFVLKEIRHDRFVLLEKNPEYWVQGRPYLDGIRYNIIKSPASQMGTVLSGQTDIVAPAITIRPFMLELQQRPNTLRFPEVTSASNQYFLLNTRKKPFDDVRLRQAVSLSLDQRAAGKAIFQDGVSEAGVFIPAPEGRWAIPAEERRKLPGYGQDAAANRAEAQRIMRELGYGPENPLSLAITTSATSYHPGASSWVAGELKAVYIRATVQPSESAILQSKLARRDFDAISYVATAAADDPDMVLYNSYACGAVANYSEYCNQDVQRLIDAQSQEPDIQRRQRLVNQAETKLVTDVARLHLGYRKHYDTQQQYVKGYVLHTGTYYTSYRMQEAWLDK
ncbi:MAG: ABC transporter substrate-binding protein [Candidatus Lambdaproteobacteria bacterium]|nr:ABC transporter substrate-binding protein [Candidatus Lambdaproteobacteria bacterium]